MAVKYIPDRGVASGHDIQVLVGHITWAMLLRREALAILSSVYAFARLGTEPIRLWENVRCELRQVADLLPLFFCDTGIGWSEKVMCTDSCDFGFGVLKEPSIPRLLPGGPGRASCSDICPRTLFVPESTLYAMTHRSGEILIYSIMT